MEAYPDITAENYKEVYDYFRTPRRNEPFSNRLFTVLDKIYQPDVHYQSDTLESLRHQTALGKGALFAINHPSNHDPFVMAGALHDINRHIADFGDVTGFGKDSLFRGPTRLLFEKTGCVPVFRRTTYTDLDPRMFSALTNELIQFAADRLKSGKHVSLMPEGTHSRLENLEQLDFATIKSGIARIALAASDKQSYIVPVGIRYRNAKPGSLFVPRGTAIVIGEPITEYEPSINRLRHQIVDGMQSALDEAVHVSKNRKP